MWWPSVTSKFAFVKSIHDITVAVSLSDANTASFVHAGKVTGVADTDLPDRNCRRRVVAVRLDFTRVVQSRTRSADGALEPAQGHSEAFRGDHHESRTARLALAFCAGGNFRFQFSRLLGALCR
jgi:hypothetical protein